MHYADKVERLKDIFGATEVAVGETAITVDGRTYPLLDDVIVLLPADRLPAGVRRRLGLAPAGDGALGVEFDAGVQYSFGEEWKSHPEILPEHEREFAEYFDLVDLPGLRGRRVADLGCGIGRWSHFLSRFCDDLVLVDYSEAIFVARRNLGHASGAIFVMGDVLDLPFREGAFDLVCCLGVLHHLPVPALDALRRLAPLASRHLIYLYYALDNRPAYFRWLLAGVTVARRRLSRVRSPRARAVISGGIAVGVYAPLGALGTVMRSRQWAHLVPLAEAYAGKSLKRLRQDVYDRFFTPIEQRFTRQQILAVGDTFSSVTVSDGIPYWHFLCTR